MTYKQTAEGLPARQRALLVSIYDDAQTWPQIQAQGYTRSDLDGLWAGELITINSADQYYPTQRGQLVRAFIFDDGRDEFGDRQREILSMSESQRRVLEQQLRQRARYHGFNLLVSDERSVDQDNGEQFDTYTLCQRSDGEPFDLENMTLFQVEEALDGLTTKEDLQHQNRN